MQQYDYRKLGIALDKALDTFGQESKKLTLHQLQYKYRISPSGQWVFTMEQLEVALREMFGAASELVVRQIKSELKK